MSCCRPPERAVWPSSVKRSQNTGMPPIRTYERIEPQGQAQPDHGPLQAGTGHQGDTVGERRGAVNGKGGEVRSLCGVASALRAWAESPRSHHPHLLARGSMAVTVG